MSTNGSSKLIEAGKDTYSQPRLQVGLSLGQSVLGKYAGICNLCGCFVMMHNSDRTRELVSCSRRVHACGSSGSCSRKAEV